MLWVVILLVNNQPGLAVNAKRARRPAITLLVNKISASTESRYVNKVEGLDRFIRFLGGPSLQLLAETGANQALFIWTASFLQLGYDTQLMSLSDAANLLCGLKRWFNLQLISSSAMNIQPDAVLRPLWQIYAHWKRVEPYDFRVPLPETLVWALVGCCLSGNWGAMALFLLLGFYGLLRPGELLGLRYGDFWWNGQGFAVLRISKPKIKSPAVQHVLLEQPWLISYCVKFFEGGTYGTVVFAWTEYILLKRWNRLFKILRVPQRPFEDMDGFSQGRFTPAGLRSGGATHDYLLHQNLDRLMWRGRWHSLAVLQHYVQLGVYTYTNQATWQASQARLEQWASMARLLLEVPAQ